MYSAIGDRFLLLTKRSKQPRQIRLKPAQWINNYTRRSPRYRRYIAPHSLSVISKKWTIEALKTHWVSRTAHCAEFSAAPWLRYANNFGQHSLQRTESMATVHDEIDNWLAADLYGELSAEEQRQLHTHLVDCAACRKTHQETKTMNKLLEETLAQHKPDPAFEQRMLTGFRNRIPEKSGLIKSLADLMRSRSAQVTAVVAVLLGLVQLGRTFTTKTATTPRTRDRYANVELEIVSFDDAVQKITAFANEDHGYVATTNSQKQANGKLRGQVIVKILPENLDRFLQKIRGLGELKNQTLGTEDVTKAYFDTDARLKNARVMEQRLIEMLKTKTGKVSDLLQVEKELGRVREDIEKMQGELKYWDSQLQFATVTISLAEKEMEEPAAFLIKERSQLALYAPDVEKIYNDIKALASSRSRGMQITNAQLNRDYSGRVSATMSMLIAPEESDPAIARVKSFGRVENFQTQTERIAQGGSPGAAGSENVKTKRDKVELNITISREEQEQAFQQTSLRIRTSSVDEKAKDLRAVAEKQGGRVRSSSFSRDPDGRELANVSLRVPMKNYPALMQSLDSSGKVENVTVQRQDRTGTQIDEANAPADISIQVYSQGNIVSNQSGPLATLRRTLAQSAGAIMWSLRMIGVAIAFLAPWVIAIVGVIWITQRVVRAKR